VLASASETVSIIELDDVGGTDQLWKVKAIRDRLRSDKTHIKNVVQRSYTAGMVLFELDTDLPSEELAELLVLDPPDKLKLQVLLIEAGSIEVRALSN